MKHRHFAALLGSIAVLLAVGCGASRFLSGGQIVEQDLSPKATVGYRATSCTNLVDKSSIPAPQDLSWHVIREGSSVKLFERSADGTGTLIENQWSTPDGDHFFVRVKDNGWEYVIPTNPSSPAQRLVYLGVETAEQGDTERPVGGPSARCELTPTSGAASAQAENVAWTIEAGGYVTSGPWHGWAWKSSPGPDGKPLVESLAGQAAGAPLCVSGTLPQTADFTANLVLGVNLNHERTAPHGTLVTPVGQGLIVNVTNRGRSPLRVQVHGASGGSDPNDRWCANLNQFDQPVLIPWAKFNATCWRNGGAAYANQPLLGAAIIVPGEQARAVPYDFCVNAMGPQGQAPQPGAPAAAAAAAAPPPLSDAEANRKLAAVMKTEFMEGQHAQAEKSLLDLLMNCGNTCSPSATASIWMHVGVVRGVGLRDQKKALEAFKLGLKLDGKAAPPTSYLDGDTLTTYQKARKPPHP